jgi:DNA-3-methyladenine glycosylase II
VPTRSPLSIATLDEQSFAVGLKLLSLRDNDLAGILKDFGPPPFWIREPGFPTLIYLILEQQVSLASAKAAYLRLLAAVKPLTPRRFLGLDDARLKTIGFSRQKTSYGRLLAESVLSRRLSLPAVAQMHDDAARETLIGLKGIGTWTADNYLLMALRRQDVWPSGDLALAVAVQKVKRLRKRPSPEKLEAMSVPWRPWRAVAARLFWHYYLSRRNGHRVNNQT